jgi:hypothetical protein
MRRSRAEAAKAAKAKVKAKAATEEGCQGCQGQGEGAKAATEGGWQAELSQWLLWAWQPGEDENLLARASAWSSQQVALSWEHCRRPQRS